MKCQYCWCRPCQCPESSSGDLERIEALESELERVTSDRDRLLEHQRVTEEIADTHMQRLEEIIDLKDENWRLREALVIAANQLEGVSIGIAKHGQNIDPAFFINTYSQNAKDARAALEKKQ